MTESLNLTDPLTELDRARQVASFLSTVFSQLAFHRDAHDLSPADLDGIGVIAGDIQARIEWSAHGIEDKLDRSDAEMLERLGMPEEAFRDESCRRAWRDGYAHALRARQAAA